MEKETKYMRHRDANSWFCRHKIRNHCKQCEVVLQGAGKNPGPYLSCSCEKSDKKSVRATIFLGGDADDAKNPKDSFWVTDEGRIACKK